MRLTLIDLIEHTSVFYVDNHDTFDSTKTERLPVNGGLTEFDSAAASGNLSDDIILDYAPKSQESFLTDNLTVILLKISNKKATICAWYPQIIAFKN